MKLLALLALMASCSAPPADVEEVQQAVTTHFYTPFGSTPQHVYLGFLTEPMLNGSGGPYTGALWVRDDTLACFWQRISTTGSNGYVANGSGNWNVHGSDQADYIEFPPVTGSFPRCSSWNGSAFNMLIGIYSPRVNTSSTVHFYVYGDGGNDTIVCDAAVTPSGNKSGASNGCYPGSGTNRVTIKHYTDYVAGGPSWPDSGDGADSVNIDVPGNANGSVQAYLFGGNDCLTWTGTACPGSFGDGGAGTDTVKSLACGLAGFESATANNCGF